MRTDFCTFLDSRDKNGVIQIKPLGLAKNKVHKPTLPGWKDVVTEISIDKKYAKGLDGIEDYSHVINDMGFILRGEVKSYGKKSFKNCQRTN